MFAISTASLYAAENAFVFGSRRLPYYERAGSPDFIDFSKIFKERKWSLIVVAVSTPPFFFFENCKKKVLIVVAVSTAPFSFVKNG